MAVSIIATRRLGGVHQSVHSAKLLYSVRDFATAGLSSSQYDLVSCSPDDSRGGHPTHGECGRR